MPPTARKGSNSGPLNPDLQLSSIGNYNFEKTIGQGNFAKVKLAKHKLTNQEVAIKIIDKTQMDEKKLSKLYREVRIMKMLNHPNIVKLYEVIETKNTLFLIMEYVSGGELYDYLVAHGKMKEKDAKAKFRQILSAVHYCHQKRVIHRDLKAENLLLDSNLNIKIADFGFSNNYQPETQLDTFCGSPPYAAPELFQGKKYTGPEVDIWSLGVILYVLCTGCLPFDGKDLREMREVVCRGKYKVPFYLSEGVEKLLKKFLVRDPTKRATLDVIADDPWLNEGETSLFVNEEQKVIEEDQTVLNVMETKFGMDRQQILKGFRENIYDENLAIYFLLYSEKQKNGDSSVTKIGEQMALKPVSLVQDLKKETVSSKPSVDIIKEDEEQHAVLTQTLPRVRQLHIEHRPRPASFVAPTNEAFQAILGDVKQTPSTPNTPPSEQPPSSTNPVEPRKRTNTITGFLKLRRPTLDAASSPSVENSQNNIPLTPTTEQKPRSLRFTFNSNTTSTKEPDEIMKQLITLCATSNLGYKLQSRYVLECTKEGVKVEVEVCKLPRLKNLYGLKFNRQSGDSQEYKALCEQILNGVQL